MATATISRISKNAEKKPPQNRIKNIESRSKNDKKTKYLFVTGGVLSGVGKGL
jgi:hypothetical protein